MELETRHKLPVLELKAAATKQWDMAREGGERGGKHRHHHALVLQLQGQTWKGRREMGAAFQQQAEALETRRSHVPGASCGKQPRPGCLPPDKAVSSSNITHSTHSSAKPRDQDPKARGPWYCSHPTWGAQGSSQEHKLCRKSVMHPRPSSKALGGIHPYTFIKAMRHQD